MAAARWELAWCAGFFDGEGSTSWSKRGYPHVFVGQRHREPLDRLQSITGCGVVYTRQMRGRDFFQFEVRGDEVEDFLDLIRPWLGTEKTWQSDRVLSRGRS